MTASVGVGLVVGVAVGDKVGVPDTVGVGDGVGPPVTVGEGVGSAVNVAVAVGDGVYFTVIAEDNSPENKYIQSAILNGKEWNNAWISHNDVAKGGTLVLKMGPKANKEWAAGSDSAPPSLTFDE